jgi:hypothetical protein
MKQKADHTVTEIKKDIPLFDSFDWVVIGMGMVGVILFIIILMGRY